MNVDPFFFKVVEETGHNATLALVSSPRPHRYPQYPLRFFPLSPPVFFPLQSNEAPLS